MLEAIVAVGRGGVIGRQGELPWPRLPADMRNFYIVTRWQTVVMGRKTAESLPMSLPFRVNLVVTHNAVWSHDSPTSEHFRNVGDAKIDTILQPALRLTPRVIVIGGAEIYRLYAPFVSTVHATVIHGDFEGDTFFPVDAFTGEWETVSEVFRPADDENPYAMTFATLKRK